MASGRREILGLYKALLRESQKFSTYNFREYALQRIRDGFREGKNLAAEEDINEHLKIARDSLGIIKRQLKIADGQKESIVFTCGIMKASFGKKV